MTDTSLRPADHPAVKFGKVGVLLVNLGTPDGTDYTSMRRYLREFLTDKRVIEWSPWKWYPILFGIVLNTRPQKVGKAYETIWNKELNESWLRTYTRNQSDFMAERLKDLPNVKVDWAMRYGTPSIPSRIEALKDEGCDRILLFPLYPQYAAATTATVNDKAFQKLLTMRWQPALRTVPDYHDDETYIEALAKSVEQHLATLDWKPEMLSPPSTASRSPISSKAIPTTASVRRQGACCASVWGSPRRTSWSPSSPASGRKNGCSPIPTRPSRSWRRTVSNASPS